MARRLLLFVFTLVLITCVKNAAGRRSLSLIPSNVLHEQASLAYAEQIKTVPLSNKNRHNNIVTRVADRLIAEAERQYPSFCTGFQWEVHLFEKPDTVNAYCMPGGKIGIYSGILGVCENEAALAAVMGHEISHALLKHGNERVSQQLGIMGGAIALEIAMAENSDMNRDLQQLIMVSVGVGAQLGVLLPFSRYHEKEADRMGLRIMTAAGYEPKEAANLWRRMKAKSGGQAPPVLLSTHPSNDQRIADLEKLETEVRPIYDQLAQKHGLGERF